MIARSPLSADGDLQYLAGDAVTGDKALLVKSGTEPGETDESFSNYMAFALNRPAEINK